MNSKLIQLDSLDMLEGDAKYIFMKTKPFEEFMILKLIRMRSIILLMTQNMLIG